MSAVNIQQVGNREYATIEEKEYKRRLGTTQWIEVDSPPPASTPPIELRLVREQQAEGEPNHWSLFLSREGENGTNYEVRGDATAMHYQHANGVNILTTDSYKDSFIIAELSEKDVARVRYWANREVPPSAPDQAGVFENCQGWTIRVVERLVAEGVVEERWVGVAMDLKEPV